jgi:histidine kinase
MTSKAANERDSFDKNSFSQPADVLNVVLDHITQGMVVVGPDYRVLAFNRYFEELFQLPHGTVEVGVDFREILKVWAHVTGQSQSMLEKAIKELDLPTPFEFEFPQMIKGESRWCLLTHNPLPSKGFVRSFADITERKRVEEEHNSLIAKLQKALVEIKTLRGILPV